MPQNDWQDALDALVKRSGGSLKGNGSDLAAALLQALAGGPGGYPAAVGLDSQAESTAPRNDWQDALDALVKRSVGSLKGNGSDGAAAAGLDSQAESAGAAADLTERLLAGVAGNLSEQASSLGEKLSELARVSQSQARTLEDNTAALGQNSLSRVGEAMKSAVSSIGGFSALSMGPALLPPTGWAPVITGIAKLFGGSKAETASSPVAAYAWPAPLRVEAGIGPSGRPGSAGGGVNYDASGVPRFDTLRVSETVPPTRWAPATRWAPEINILVQAIDSRSFMDHSEEIARAVREAMLESHMLSDVVSEF